MKKALSILLVVFLTMGGTILGLNKHRITSNTEIKMEQGKLYSVNNLSFTDSGLKSIEVQVGDKVITINGDEIINNVLVYDGRIGTNMVSVLPNGKIYLDKYVDGIQSNKYMELHNIKG